MAKTAEDKMVDELRDMNRELRRIKDRMEDNKYIWQAISRPEKPSTRDIRPCYISKKCFKHGPKRAVFHRWIEIKSPNMTQTLAIVEYEDGSVEQVKPTSIIFADSGWLFDEYYWLPEEEDDVEDEESTTQGGDTAWAERN